MENGKRGLKQYETAQSDEPSYCLPASCGLYSDTVGLSAGRENVYGWALWKIYISQWSVEKRKERECNILFLLISHSHAFFKVFFLALGGYAGSPKVWHFMQVEGWLSVR